MPIELRVTSGARAGARETFSKSVIAIGRHPLNDLRLDAERDLDVSARHAEIRVVGTRATVRDVGSSNGTRVNGEPLVGERALVDGDVIALGGATGATLEFRFVSEPTAGDRVPITTPIAPPRRDTTVRIADAVAAQTGRLRRVLYVFGAAVIAVMLALAWMSRLSTSSDRATIDRLLADLQAQNAAIAQLRGSANANGLTDEVGRIRHERDSLLAVLRAGGNAEALGIRIAELSRQQDAAGAVSRVDYVRIAAENTRAVAFIVVQQGDVIEGGSGFGVTRNGIIVTNRHVVQLASDSANVKIAVQFHGTRAWLPAHVMKVSTTDDLAFLKVDAAGVFPTVVGVSPSGGVQPGTPIAIVGYPLGIGTAGMGGSIDTLTVRATLTAGIVSKSLPDVLQVDAYVAAGSSGSPVFDRRGLVVGVVYGGPTEAAGRIVYSVPSNRLLAQLPGEAAGMVRP